MVGITGAGTEVLVTVGTDGITGAMADIMVAGTTGAMAVFIIRFGIHHFMEEAFMVEVFTEA